ncbi:MAG: hypothetical protein WCO09_04540, partial [bacterium]
MSLRNKNKISSRGSVAFTFYFIIALGLLAVAGYYIGINEQTSLFKDIVQRKQTQEDAILNSIADNQSVYTPTASTAKNDAIKSLIDSPNVVLRNLRASHDASVQSGANQNASSTLGNILIGQNVDTNSVETQTIITFAKQAQYLIYTNANKHGSNIKLIDGETKGDVCYNTATERVCYPHYKLEKIWSVGDLNNDGAGDAIISISAEEKILEKNVITDNFYAIISDPNSVTVDKKTQKASSTPISLSPETVSYSVAPFGYGLYSPLISSAEIVDGNAILIGNFYADNDAIGSPSVSKAIR